MFEDTTTIKLGEQLIKIRRLTLAEIRAERARFKAGAIDLDSSYDEIIRTHCTLDDGSPIDAAKLSMRQVQTLVTELVGIPKEGGISDFIGLLC